MPAEGTSRSPFLELKLHGPTISPERLGTNTTSSRHPVHRWFNFIAGFSPEFVEQCIAGFDARAGRLLDPFAGCATAPLAACQRGLDAVGFEPHPVLVRVARAKMDYLQAAGVLGEIGRVLREGLRRPQPVNLLSPAAARFLQSLFPVGHLGALLGARDALRAELGGSDLAFLVLSRVVECCSHSQTDGIYKAPTTRKSAQDPQAAVDKVLAMIEADMRGAIRSGRRPSGVIHEQSSTDMSVVPDGSVDVIVTSPPYLNNFDFAEMTRMLLYFWGIAGSWREISEKVRAKLIVNTTTALTGHKGNQAEHREGIPAIVRRHLDELVAALAAQRKTRAGKKAYDYLVYPYFHQLTGVLGECHRASKTGAPIHLMVADAALYGVHVDTPQILRRILASIGYRSCECQCVRQRGHRWILDKRDGSKQGLGEYHVQAVK